MFSSSSSSSSSSNSSGNNNSYTAPKGWDIESDDKVRGCKVHLYRRNVGLFAYHWALIFEFNGGYQATYEAMDENGTLTARWKQGGVEEKSDDGEIYKWYHYDTYETEDCSPKQVNSKARSLRIGNMQYNPMSINCHEWAKALASCFGVSLPPGIVCVLRFGSRPQVTFKEPREWCRESDNIERRCKLHLYRRHCRAVVAYQWALHFDWEGGYTANYEAMNENGILTAHWKEGGVELKSDDGELYEWTFCSTYDAANCSPEQVNLLARSLRIGDMKCNNFSINCYEWAKILAWQVSVVLSTGLPSVEEVDSSQPQPITFLLAATDQGVTFPWNKSNPNQAFEYKPDRSDYAEDYSVAEIVGRGIGRFLTNN